MSYSELLEHAQKNTQQSRSTTRCLKTYRYLPVDRGTTLIQRYPAMKLGVRSHIAFYAQKLLPLAQAHIDENPQCRNWVITAPAYSAIPAAANLICWQIATLLKQSLGESLTLVNLKLPRQQMAINDADDFKTYYEYSRNSLKKRIEERRRLHHNDDIIRRAAEFKDRGVIVINDIYVTGTQQHFMQKSFDRAAVKNLQWLYILGIEKTLASRYPQIEHSINSAYIQTRDEFCELLCADDIDYTARCISRLFSHDTTDFKYLLDKLNHQKRCLILDLAMCEGRFDGDFFAKKLQILRGLCQRKINTSVRKFDIDYRVPFVERSQINGPHYQIPVDNTHSLFDDPLVNLKEYSIEFESYHAISDGSNPPYFKPIQGSRQEGWLRKTYVEKLVRVNEHLRPYGAELLILDAYRSIECQRGLWRFFYERGRTEIPNATEEDCRRYALGYVRDPRHYDTLDARTWPIHITGSSVDVTLRDIETKELRDMGSKFEQIIDVSKTDYFEHQLAKGLIAEDDPRLLNRRLMDWAFTREDFLNDPILYWHYDWGNQIWIKVKNALEIGSCKKNAPSAAWYGHIGNPDWSVEDASLIAPKRAKHNYL